MKRLYLFALVIFASSNLHAMPKKRKVLEYGSITGLLSMAKGGDFDGVVSQLVDHSINPSCRDEHGNTPMHLAAYGYGKKYTNIILMLATCKSTLINTTNHHGMTPLHYAASGGCTYNVAALLNKGASKNILDTEGQTPLHWATFNEHDDDQRYAQTIEKLISEKTINKRDKHGRTPLMRAVQNGHLNNAAALLKYGADANIFDECKYTPLHHVALTSMPHARKKALLKLLANFGARTDILNQYDDTPYDLLPEDEYTNEYKQLLDACQPLNNNE